MASGGARNRSGPAADPLSALSDARGIRLDALPSEGRAGAPPTPWPLTAPQVYIERVTDSGKPVKELDPMATEERRQAEEAMWESVWSYPQAVVWERDR